MVAELSFQAPPGIKDLRELLEPLPHDCSLPPTLLKLFNWAKSHYLASPGELLRSFFPTSLLRGEGNKGEGARTPDTSPVFIDNKVVNLNPAQRQAVETLKAKLGTFFPLLLQGVTGSGKTEVYLRLCEEVLAQQGAALILVPEIALTPQIVGRFKGRFENKVGSYHSNMTERQRLQTWWAAKEGRQKIIVGTRSSLCLPVKDLSLIIIDEEHDQSYKQEERFRYHGRDLAVVRAALEKIPIVLGSATPSLETQENVHSGKYQKCTLPDRATRGVLPKIHLVDLRENPPHPETLLSEGLKENLHKTLDRGEQALFFLNRRGFAPFVLCRDCGEVIRCPNCEISLTYHKKGSVLKCHYCDFHMPKTNTCSQCGGFNLDAIGVGTERLEENFLKEFPGVRIGRLDRDVVSSKRKTEEILSQFATGQIDVLIGTQLVTKGHDFKQLTLVGILLADVTLNLPDFRAAERVFQIVTQVAGRAGRHELPGEVFLQTFRPEHYAITSALVQDPEKFYVQEITHRRSAGYPPFSRVVLLRLSGTHCGKVEQACGQLTSSLRSLFRGHEAVKILGPAPSTLEKLRGKFRWQTMIRTTKFEGMRRILEDKIPQLESNIPSGIRLHIDVDPVGMF